MTSVAIWRKGASCRMRSLISRPRFILFALVVVVLLYTLSRFRQEIQTTIKFTSRSLRSSSPTNTFRVLPHFHAEDMISIENVCALHGWPQRDPMEFYKREMWDTIILSGPTEAELDLVEVRLLEQSHVMDRVFILESNRTINGTPKRLYFEEELYKRFEPVRNKIIYQHLLSPPPHDPNYPSASEWAAYEREQLTALLRTRVYNTVLPPIVIFAAPDEIVYPNTLRLLQECKFPSPLTMQMRRYLYSFEWPVGWGWDVQVKAWDSGREEEAKKSDESKVVSEEEQENKNETISGDSQYSELALADAGWQCSYCLKKIEDVLDKARDEFGAKSGSLNTHNIQEALCEGKDVFNVIPRLHSHKDKFEVMNAGPSKSGMFLPRTLLERNEQLKHLLPGGCLRSE